MSAIIQTLTFAGSALTSTAVLCAQLCHSPGASPVAKPAQKCSSIPSSPWWFLTPQPQCQLSNSIKAAVQEPAEWHSYPQSHQNLTGTQPYFFGCRGTLPLCSGCAFITAQTGSLGQPESSSWWIGYVAAQWEMWTSFPHCLRRKIIQVFLFLRQVLQGAAGTVCTTSQFPVPALHSTRSSHSYLVLNLKM